MTHTPGPWVVTPGDSVVAIHSEDGKRVAATNTQTYYQKYTETDMANARLIAAAPDLLAALKDAMRSSRKDFKSGPDGDRQYREAYAEQFAAIAKATGAA